MTTREDFVTRFGGIIEHSPYLAERAFDHGLVASPLTAVGVQEALVTELRRASEEERLGVLRAHPDLAGRLAVAGKLTEESRKEQAGAGLDRLTPEQFARFTELNDTYMAKFGFPFIIAVKGLTRDDILAAFEVRVNNDRETEFATACAQVERIVALRLETLFSEG